MIEKAKIEFGIMTFLMAGRFFALPIDKVSNVVAIQPISPIPSVPSYFKGMIITDGELLPVVDINERFLLQSYTKHSDKSILILNMNNNGNIYKLGVVVDKALELNEVEPETCDLSELRLLRIPEEYVSSTLKIQGLIYILLKIDDVFNYENIVFNK